METKRESLKDILPVLPDRIAFRIRALPDEIKRDIQEIRLRINKPVALTCNNLTYYLTDKSFTADIYNNLNYFKAVKTDITETFTKACTYSVYNRQGEIANGFITINGGHRMGITGSAVYNSGELINIKDISSINIRLSKEFVGCSKFLFDELQNNLDSLLICGRPCSGKTTLIRDIARSLSVDFGKKVCVIDSRNEISGTYRGEILNDLGNCDIFSMYRKTDGIEQAIRNMSPDYVICDEIVNFDEVSAISKGLNSGVKFIATMHCSSYSELVKKPIYKKLVNLKAFSNAVILKNNNHPTEIDEIIDLKEKK